MTNTKPKLAFGYNAGIPDDCEAAWGARWIITQDGMVDHLQDRQGLDGTEAGKAQVLDALNTGLGGEAKLKLREMLISNEISTRSEDVVTLAETDTIKVVGSPNASAGYFYVSAYLK